AEVFLIDVTVVAHDECRDAGDAIRRRIRHEREAPDHVSLDDVVVGAAGSGRTLREQRAIQIPVIWLPLALLGPSIAGGSRLGHEQTERAQPFAGLRLPVEAVPLTAGALETLGILENPGAPVPRVVFALRVNVGEAYLDGSELVSPDPAKENLVVPG